MFYLDGRWNRQELIVHSHVDELLRSSAGIWSERPSGVGELQLQIGRPWGGWDAPSSYWTWSSREEWSSLAEIDDFSPVIIPQPTPTPLPV